MLSVLLFVLRSFHMVIFFSSVKGTLLKPTDRPWRLRLVDAVTREVTPTSAVGEHASASQQPTRMCSFEKKPVIEDGGEKNLVFIPKLFLYR